MNAETKQKLHDHDDPLGSRVVLPEDLISLKMDSVAIVGIAVENNNSIKSVYIDTKNNLDHLHDIGKYLFDYYKSLSKVEELIYRRNGTPSPYFDWNNKEEFLGMAGTTYYAYIFDVKSGEWQYAYLDENINTKAIDFQPLQSAFLTSFNNPIIMHPFRSSRAIWFHKGNFSVISCCNLYQHLAAIGRILESGEIETLYVSRKNTKTQSNYEEIDKTLMKHYNSQEKVKLLFSAPFPGTHNHPHTFIWKHKEDFLDRITKLRKGSGLFPPRAYLFDGIWKYAKPRKYQYLSDVKFYPIPTAILHASASKQKDSLLNAIKIRKSNLFFKQSTDRFFSDSKSVYLMLQSAKLDNAKAQNRMGTIYEYGEDVKQDDTKAAKWYRKAAKQGNADAQNNLGWLYKEGKGVKQDDTKVAKWYRKAAEQEHADAQNNLGWLYKEGKGVKQDDTKAAKWYRKAAEQEHADAQNNLGMLYACGEGVPKDYQKAVEWFYKAAEQGYAIALCNLSYMHELGLGVKKNILTAYALLLLAIEERYEKAREDADNLKKELTTEQIRAGQKIVEEWKKRIKASKRRKKRKKTAR